MIILLDLNYTLVENSDDKRRPFIKQIEAEQYRHWLVELLREHHVILMTARPAMHRQATLDSIRTKAAWLPQEAHFNSYGLMPPLAKARMLKEHVLPKHGGAKFLAIESNPRTQAMYATHGIKSVKIMPGERWDALPE